MTTRPVVKLPPTQAWCGFIEKEGLDTQFFKWDHVQRYVIRRREKVPVVGDDEDVNRSRNEWSTHRSIRHT